MTDLDLIKAAIHEAYGPPCDDFDPECAGCKTWKAFGRFQWQPIETAPKDGRLLIIRTKSGDTWSGTFVGYWSHSSWMYSIDRPIHKPTHWRPLPEPPEQNGTKT